MSAATKGIIEIRHNSKRNAGIGIAAFGFLGMCLEVFAAHSFGEKALAALVGIAWAAVMMWRFGGEKVICDDDGIRVRNFIRTIRVPWKDIDRFEFGPSWINPWIGLVVLRNGRYVSIGGIQGPQFARGDSGRMAEQRALIARLDQLLTNARIREDRTA